ncbi:hypothetical protein HYU72_01900, partial [Candidatus Berkelbacteria bacterium]|nr:hypothetical protein [Candidatus Berkelbacteria bacterium]
EAIEAAARNGQSFDLLITDYLLGFKRTGLELAYELAELAGPKGLPAIIMSGEIKDVRKVLIPTMIDTWPGGHPPCLLAKLELGDELLFMVEGLLAGEVKGSI